MSSSAETSLIGLESPVSFADMLQTYSPNVENADYCINITDSLPSAVNQMHSPPTSVKNAAANQELALALNTVIKKENDNISSVDSSDDCDLAADDENALQAKCKSNLSFPKTFANSTSNQISRVSESDIDQNMLQNTINSFCNNLQQSLIQQFDSCRERIHRQSQNEIRSIHKTLKQTTKQKLF